MIRDVTIIWAALYSRQSMRSTQTPDRKSPFHGISSFSWLPAWLGLRYVQAIYQLLDTLFLKFVARQRGEEYFCPSAKFYYLSDRR